MARDYTFTADETAMLHELVSSHCKALHNWLASAVEAGNMDKAKLLLRELRAHEKLYGRTNVQSHVEVATYKDGQYDQKLEAAQASVREARDKLRDVIIDLSAK